MSTFLVEVQPAAEYRGNELDLAREALDIEAGLYELLRSVGATSTSVSWALEDGATRIMLTYDASHLVDAGIRHQLQAPGSPYAILHTYRLFTAEDYAAHMEVATAAGAA